MTRLVAGGALLAVAYLIVSGLVMWLAARAAGSDVRGPGRPFLVSILGLLATLVIGFPAATLLLPAGVGVGSVIAAGYSVFLVRELLEVDLARASLVWGLHLVAMLALGLVGMLAASWGLTRLAGA